jgi:hypothetical protein
MGRLGETSTIENPAVDIEIEVTCSVMEEALATVGYLSCYRFSQL